MGQFKITFCWGTKLPIELIVDSEETRISKRNLVVLADSGDEALRKLKGTKSKVLSMINTIKCIQ